MPVGPLSLEPGTSPRRATGGLMATGNRTGLIFHGTLFNSHNLKKWLYPHESIDDLLNPVFYRDVFVECVLCAYVMACVIWALMTLNKEAYSPSTTHFGLFAGFFVMMVIEAYGPICGAPINPAGCWGFFLAGRLSFARGMYRPLFLYGVASINLHLFYRDQSVSIRVIFLL